MMWGGDHPFDPRALRLLRARQAEPAAALNPVLLLHLGRGSRFSGRSGPGRAGRHPLSPRDLSRWRTLLLRAALGQEAPSGAAPAAGSADGRAMRISSDDM